MLNDDIMIELY